MEPMDRTWVGRLCVCVPGRGIVAARNPRHHLPSQWKFPGGRRAPQDRGWQETASRRTHEEVGMIVPPASISFLDRSVISGIDNYIGFALLLERNIAGLGRQPLANEDVEIISLRQFEEEHTFIEHHHKLVAKFALFKW
jgi:ADP-ribose pyrophosphatase YjhB (NUDIX family)